MTITTAEKQLSSPRELCLCKSEKDSLCQLIRNVLNVDPSNDEDIEEADILIEYVCDMIDEKAKVGHIIKELVLMEMSICGIKVATKLGGCLVHFFQTLDDESEVVVEERPKKQLAKPSSSTRLPIQNRKPTTHKSVTFPSKQAKKVVPPTSTRSSSSSRFDLTCGRSAPSSSLEHSRYLKEETRRTAALTAEPSSKSKKQRSSAKTKMSHEVTAHVHQHQVYNNRKSSYEGGYYRSSSSTKEYQGIECHQEC